MKRLRKSKCGFSLLEMIVVVAIIIILAAVLVMSIGTYISNSKSKSSQADSARSVAEDNIRTEESRMVELGFANSSDVRVVAPSSMSSVSDT